jgi:rod shape-determining protein MreD
MIMPPGKPLLLPANPWFIWGSLLAALVLNMLLSIAWGRLFWSPDFLALTLVFWNVHQPQRVGVGAAFSFGLLMDVQQTTLLGQHALAYAILGYLAVSVHRRLLWFSVPTQTVHVLPLFFLAHLLVSTLRLLMGGNFPEWNFFLTPILTAALWPLATLLLLAPQRRPHDPDVHRPL